MSGPDDIQNVTVTLPPQAGSQTVLAVTGPQGPPGATGPQPPLGSATPLGNGAADAGTATSASREDHVHPTDTSRASAAALSAHTGNTSNPHGTTSAQVGLGNVNNTSDANKPVSTAQQAALDLKAPIASPTFTGTVGVAGGITSTGAGTNVPLVLTAKGSSYIALQTAGGATCFATSANAGQPDYLNAYAGTGSSYLSSAGGSTDIDLALVPKGAGRVLAPASGIIFGSGNAALKSYEEGTWTPAIAGGTTPGTQTYSSQLGRYVRIGDIVHAHFRCVMTAKDAATAGNIRITGLPFAQPVTPGILTSFALKTANLPLDTGYGWTFGYLGVGNSFMTPAEGNPTTGVIITIPSANLANNSEISGHCAYYVGA